MGCTRSCPCLFCFGCGLAPASLTLIGVNTPALRHLLPVNTPTPGACISSINLVLKKQSSVIIRSGKERRWSHNAQPDLGNYRMIKLQRKKSWDSHGTHWYWHKNLLAIKYSKKVQLSTDWVTVWVPAPFLPKTTSRLCVVNKGSEVWGVNDQWVRWWWRCWTMAMFNMRRTIGAGIHHLDRGIWALMLVVATVLQIGKFICRVYFRPPGSHGLNIASAVLALNVWWLAPACSHIGILERIARAFFDNVKRFAVTARIPYISGLHLFPNSTKVAWTKQFVFISWRKRRKRQRRKRDQHNYSSNFHYARGLFSMLRGNRRL